MKPPTAVEELLRDLRWTADRVITNYSGERVWLTHCDGGITDCCRADAPCSYHASLTNQAWGTVQ